MPPVSDLNVAGSRDPDPDADYGRERGDDYRQSTTACCPRDTIPDDCNCPDDCQCLCTDCSCQGDGDWDEICRCSGICTCGGW